MFRVMFFHFTKVCLAPIFSKNNAVHIRQLPNLGRFYPLSSTSFLNVWGVFPVASENSL